ncbi:condensation domain-containing protein, partial [Kibdelosporangium lantanae]
LAAYAHQDLPFERLVEVLNPERSLSRHPLFQTMVVLQNNERPRLDVPGVDVRFGSAETGAVKFDLYFSITEQHTADGRRDGIDVRLEYATDLFDHATAVRLGELFTQVLTAATTEPDRPVRILDLAPGAPVTAGPSIPAGPTVRDLVQQWVTRRPDAPAVVTDNEVLSYHELDRRAN